MSRRRVTLTFQSPDWNELRNPRPEDMRDYSDGFFEVEVKCDGFDLDHGSVTIYPDLDTGDNLVLANPAPYCNENGDECGDIGWCIEPEQDLLAAMPELVEHAGRRFGRLIVTAEVPTGAEGDRPSERPCPSERTGPYGSSLPGDEWKPLRGVIGEVETTPAGNIALRIGRQTCSYWRAGAPVVNGWTQTEHVVCTPDETLNLCAELLGKLNDAAEWGSEQDAATGRAYEAVCAALGAKRV